MRVIIDQNNLLEHLIGFCVISGFMLIILLVGRVIKGVDAFGGGDIKLMAVAGLFLGYKNCILAFFIGCILGSVIHLILMRVCKKEHMLAFGPYLSMGIFIAMLYGDTIVNWYLSLCM